MDQSFDARETDPNPNQTPSNTHHKLEQVHLMSTNLVSELNCFKHQNLSLGSHRFQTYQIPVLQLVRH